MIRETEYWPLRKSKRTPTFYRKSVNDEFEAVVQLSN